MVELFVLQGRSGHSSSTIDLLHQAPGSHRQFGFTPKDLSPHFLTHWLLFYVVFILDDD